MYALIEMIIMVRGKVSSGETVRSPIRFYLLLVIPNVICFAYL